ncbi:MAG: type IX secretion system membrane protein PorP/SprF [Chitinophagales bacterium]|nr:type IX secretion system membrane protein PorP/SprF [Chitinophagales bacterium]
MKKLLFVLIIFFASAAAVEAQQIYQLTQYMLNDFAYNPAVAGKGGQLIDAKITYRKQWAGGFDGDEPSTFLLGGHTSLNEAKSVGVGVLIYADKTGPTRRTGVELAYAYHLPFNNSEQHLSFGIGANILNYGIDFNKLNLSEAGDPAVASNTDAKTTIDFNFGTYFYSANYWLGLSINNLAGRSISLSDEAENNEGTIELARHLFISGGYQFDIAEDFALEPSVLFKSAAESQFDINLRGIYQEQYWAGLSVRPKDAIAILVGVALNNGFNAAYSYDITTSGLNAVSNGSHEICIGYKFGWGVTNDVPAAF